MGSIALGASGDMRMTTKCRMSSLPTVLALQNTWVHVGTALRIPNVYPDHCYVRFGRCFDDTRFLRPT